jgi:hypothetical protein
MLNKYERVLESWDDRVAPEWILPDSPYLDCDDWLLCHKVYTQRESIVRKRINEAFRNIS